MVESMLSGRYNELVFMGVVNQPDFISTDFMGVSIVMGVPPNG